MSVVDQTVVDSNNAFEATNLLMWKRKRPWIKPLVQQREAVLPPWREQAPPCKRSLGSAAQPVKNYGSGSRSSGNAAHPITKPGKSSAERPAHRVAQSEKRAAVGKKLLTSVAYLKLPACPEKEFTQDAAQRCAVGMVQKAKEVGADVINIVFEREADIVNMGKELQAEMRPTSNHRGFDFRRVAQLLTLFSPDCGRLEHEDLTGFEDGVPVICLTLSGPHENCGPMIIINAASERLPQPSRKCRTNGNCNVLHCWVPCDRGKFFFWVRWESGQVKRIVSGLASRCNAQGQLSNHRNENSSNPTIRCVPN